jgi:hypothetical protein
MSARRAAVMLFAFAALAPTRAAAHPAPATPPTFAPGACITVVDTREQQALQLAYDVAVDDDIFAEGEIQLPDAKTHQFFSFAGLVAKNPSADGYQLFPFDAAIDQPLALPLWLDQSDVNRAAAAVRPVDMLDFTASQVQPGDVLALRSDLASHVRAITSSTERVPITKRQAEKGVHWDLRALLPGLYSVVGYVFSPAYNDWAARAGIIKVVDGKSAVPAAVIEPIDKTVFAGQGRRVRGCVDAPVGSTLSAWVRAEDQPNAAWEAWLAQKPLAEIGKDGSFELCFSNQAPGRSGVLRVRIEVTAPDGQRSAAYSSDTLLAVPTPAACTASEDTCCAESASVADAGRDPSSTTPVDAGAPQAGAQPEAGAQLEAGAQQLEAGVPAEAAPLAGSADRDPERRDAGGCTIRAGETPDFTSLALALLWAMASASRQRGNSRRKR